MAHVPSELGGWLVDSLGCGVLAVDAAGAVVVFNAPARDLLGAPCAPLGRSCREVLAGQPEVVGVLLESLEGRSRPARSELWLARPDRAAATPIAIRASVLRAESGDVRGAAILFREPRGDVSLDRQAGSADQRDLYGIGGVAAPVVAESAAMRAAVDLARRVGPSRSTVLISGETGTGKEIVAGLVHRFSPRRSQPLVKVNCAALPETLLESELFGHERGAFTGAERQRVGRFEQASGGTLFLDEVADMSPATQAKLLRVLQDQEFQRLGGTRPLRTDARIVAATNCDLEHAVGSGRFREDLYFRLNVIGIPLAPLRERPEDAVELARRFLQHFGSELGRCKRGFTPAARARIAAYAWPGNVRELRNAIERAVLMADGDVLDASDLVLGDSSGSERARSARLELPVEGVSLAEVERQLVVAALRRTGFVQKDAAKLLGVTRRKLNYMIARMGLTHASWRRNRETGSPPAGDGGSAPGDAAAGSVDRG